MIGSTEIHIFEIKFSFWIRNTFEIRSTVLLTSIINVECRNPYARVRNDPYKVISFPLYFESTSRNEMQQVTVAIRISTE